MGDAIPVKPAAGSRRVLLLCDMNEPAPRPLLSLLAKRKFRVRVAPDVSAVMVELAKGSRNIVIVNEPKHKLGLKHLVNAINRYHSETPCWQYVQPPNGEPQLSVLDKLPTYEPPDLESMSPVQPFAKRPITAAELAMLTGENTMQEAKQ